MQFLYPYFLFGLLAIAIPVIIHLFNFRRFRKIYFSNVAFLKEVQIETHRRHRIRQWLVLVSRILAITALVLAFAQPFIPNTSSRTNRQAGQIISIFVDNSFSMDAQQKDGRLLDVALTYANEIIKSCKDIDKIQILTQDFEGKHQVLYSPSEAGDLLNEIKITSQVHPLSEVIQRQSDLLLKQPDIQKKIYILSDFQQSFSDVASVRADSSLSIQLIPITPNTQRNLYIDSVWMEQPALHVGGTAELKVRIRNISDQPYDNMPLRVEVNGSQKSPVLFNIQSNEVIELPMVYTIQENGFHEFRITLDDDQITFDDDMYFSFLVHDHIPVYLIEGSHAGVYMQRLFSSDTYFDLKISGDKQIDYSQFSNRSLIILNGLQSIATGLTEELFKFINDGGTVLLIPPADMDKSAYQSFCSKFQIATFQSVDTADARIARIQTNDPFYGDVFESIPENMDLPMVFKHWIISTQSAIHSIPILKMRNGYPFYMRFRPQKGQIYMLTTPMAEDWTNFPKHALLVPTILKTAFSSVQQSPLYYTLGANVPISLRNRAIQRDRVLKIRNASKTYEMIPLQRTIETTSYLFLNHALQDAGFYAVYDGDEIISRFAVNYSRMESNPQIYTSMDLSSLIKENHLQNIKLIDMISQNLHQQLADSGLGTQLWKLFIILSLIFTGIEIILIRFLK